MARAFPSCVGVSLLWVGLATMAFPAEPGVVRMASLVPAEAREMSSRLDSMLREGRLRVTRVDEDTMLPGRQHERLAQSYKGVPVYGGEVVRQIDETGAVVSVFGRVYEGIDLEVQPALSSAQATAVVAERAGGEASFPAAPELTILPTSDTTLALAWSVVAASRGDVRRYFVDARAGRVILEHSLIARQTPAVGRGVGVLNNNHKISAASAGGQYLAIDLLRPARITTHDLKGNILRANAVVNALINGAPPNSSDVAVDSDNNWTDGPTVDAHAYAGWVYDYYFKRLGRRGWNNADQAIPQFVNPARQEDFFVYGGVLGEFFLNAFYCCSGLPASFMVYGQGLPAGVWPGGQVKPIAGALDAVAHEMTHGVTKYTSGLSLAFCFAGGLSESFSDQMAISVDFFYRPSTANYRVGEDVVPGGLRDLANPGLFGDPDHIAVATICEEHYLAGVPNQAFYLAIEGGTNRTSGIPVQGVGSGNREQIEKVFYRAFTLKLGPASNYVDAANATVQAARELYGAGSAAERAVIEAWTAVLFL